MSQMAKRLISSSGFSIGYSIGQIRQLHASPTLCFHFLKRQVTVDPELAALRENRKRRKLEKAIKQLKEFSKKPTPVEEMQIDIKLRQTLDERKREVQPISEEERQRRVILLKQFGRAQTKMAREDSRWIRESMECQLQALNLLKQISPKLYEAAVQPDTSLLPLRFEGPALTPPLASYKSPDGDYTDVTKQWVQPVMPSLNKKFGIGKLIKTPAFKRKQAETIEKKAVAVVEEKKQMAATG